jgi:hypothetical protein
MTLLAPQTDTQKKRVILAVARAAEGRLQGLFPTLATLSTALGCEVQIVVEADVSAQIPQAAAAAGFSLSAPHGGPVAARRALLRGEQDDLSRVAFISDPDRIDAALLARFRQPSAARLSPRCSGPMRS